MFNGSWGLNLDLGEEVPDSAIQALYNYVWQKLGALGPDFEFGQYRQCPQAAEGRLQLQDQTGKCYTKFEEDSLGYPPGWLVPVSFSLSLFGFESGLPENTSHHQFLLEQAREMYQIHPYRMAMIGDLTAYYLNLDLLNTDWIDLHQTQILSLMLSTRHPFTRQHPGQAFAADMSLYGQAELKGFWTTDEVPTRYLRFKKSISKALHPEHQPLEWETPSDN